MSNYARPRVKSDIRESGRGAGLVCEQGRYLEHFLCKSLPEVPVGKNDQEQEGLSGWGLSIHAEMGQRS